MYTMLVLSHFAYQWSQLAVFVIAISGIQISVISLWIFLDQTIIFQGIPSKQLNSKTFGFILLSLFFALFMGIATLNYASYMIKPEWYVLSGHMSYSELGFEFVYYTFSLMLTYSGDTIQAVSVASKLLQMIEIGAFYILFAIQLSELLANYKEAIKLHKE